MGNGRVYGDMATLSWLVVLAGYMVTAPGSHEADYADYQFTVDNGLVWC